MMPLESVVVSLEGMIKPRLLLEGSTRYGSTCVGRRFVESWCTNLTFSDLPAENPNLSGEIWGGWAMSGSSVMDSSLPG